MGLNMIRPTQVPKSQIFDFLSELVELRVCIVPSYGSLDMLFKCYCYVFDTDFLCTESFLMCVFEYEVQYCF